MSVVRRTRDGAIESLADYLHREARTIAVAGANPESRD